MNNKKLETEFFTCEYFIKQKFVFTYWYSKYHPWSNLRVLWEFSDRSLRFLRRTDHRSDSCTIEAFHELKLRWREDMTFPIKFMIFNNPSHYYYDHWKKCKKIGKNELFRTNRTHYTCSTLTMSWIKDIRKFQSSLMASFSSTSFKDPRGQYSVRIKTVGEGEQMHAPMNLKLIQNIFCLRILSRINYSRLVFRCTWQYFRK